MEFRRTNTQLTFHSSLKGGKPGKSMEFRRANTQLPFHSRSKGGKPGKSMDFRRTNTQITFHSRSKGGKQGKNMEFRRTNTQITFHSRSKGANKEISLIMRIWPQLIFNSKSRRGKTRNDWPGLVPCKDTGLPAFCIFIHVKLWQIQCLGLNLLIYRR